MLFGSIFLWAFVGASLVLCTVYLEEYAVNHAIGRFVLGSSIYASLGISAVMTVLARRFAVPKALGSMTGAPYSDSRLNGVFAGLCRKMGVLNVELREAKVGNAFSIGLSERRLVAVSPSLIQSLSMEETEAVLAHELSHLKNRDSIAKGLARFARFAFPFDPSIRLVEAAVHRERELLADRSSVRVTQKPLALASALIKVHSGPASSLGGIGAGLFIGGRNRGLLSLYPDLQQRIELLLKLARTMRVAAEVPA
jgi:heat shock protein HtpX